MIFIENRRKSVKTLKKLHPIAEIIDVTSKGKDPFVKLSPFYPHSGIPIPFSENLYSNSVEGIWQGLKVFEHEDIDPSKFKIIDMKGLKRIGSKLGKTLGHRNGVVGTELFDYITARKTIYIPSYEWVLENKVKSVIEHLVQLAQNNDLVLLDYETNCDIENISKPLSHAGLVKKYIEKIFPEIMESKIYTQSLAPIKPLIKSKRRKSANSRIRIKGSLDKNNISLDNHQLTMNF